MSEVITRRWRIREYSQVAHKLLASPLSLLDSHLLEAIGLARRGERLKLDVAAMLHLLLVFVGVEGGGTSHEGREQVPSCGEDGEVGR